MSNPILSVIVPVYNVKKYLHQCIDSVIGQTINDFEIILVDDGSTDDSPQICDEYAEKDARVIVIHQKNMGLAAARQSGLDRATGKYIGFIDSDDWIEPDMYETMVEKAIEFDADIVFCNTYRNEDKKEKPYLKNGYYALEQMKESIYPRLLAGFDSMGRDNTIRWCNWLRIYKKELIDRNHIRFDNRFRRCQDLPFTFECTIHANSYYYLGDRYLYHNRMNYESLSKGYTKNMWGLIKPLVKYLQQVVDDYDGYDFAEQMNSRAALFAFECCENENKPNNTKPLSERYATISEIMKDSDAQKWIKAMKLKGKSRRIKFYALCFRLRLARVFYRFADGRFKNRKSDYNKLVKN